MAWPSRERANKRIVTANKDVAFGCVVEAQGDENAEYVFDDDRSRRCGLRRNGFGPDIRTTTVDTYPGLAPLTASEEVMEEGVAILEKALSIRGHLCAS
ncbi:hypothetical protein ABENE_11325 [Asticcacaulis benevestitus DSM 16100 = ATCC BAA-896]|uniref:Uncharacterized protein n=1 Tax=Asticcacaulis benevestitus DSM 16100 = ATCC BAA-896 TaxID=1121022 RepID=V4PZN6_9CAUL|nr:hypothetical protein ABENE_11325 [Asticcacaulis benevestitus DSM 16100 = ATCC BAA-896]